MDNTTGTDAPGVLFKQRAFTRVPFCHGVRWSYAPGESGHARVRDVGRGGMCLALGRYLRPGRVLRLYFDDIHYEGEPLELEARIVWCESTARGHDRFRAGFQVLHGKPVTLAKVSEIFYVALTRLANERYPCKEPAPEPLNPPSLAS